MHRYRHSAALIAAAVVALAWGDSLDGLRLGVGFDGPSKIEVAIENDGKVQRNIPLGSSSPKGAVYDFEFRVAAPNGNEIMLFDLNGPAGIAPAPDPLIAHIAPRQTWQVSLPLEKFVIMEGSRQRTLPDLLAHNYSVHVILDTTAAARVERTRSEWTGRLRSGELRR